VDVIDITLDIFPIRWSPELVHSIESAGQRSLVLGKLPSRRFLHRQITEILVSPGLQRQVFAIYCTVARPPRLQTHDLWLTVCYVACYLMARSKK
jgi:hypothetical protein